MTIYYEVIMLNTVKANEIALAADEIRRRSLTDSGVCIIGKGLLCDAVKATSEVLGEKHAFCGGTDTIPADCCKLWYIAEADTAPDLDAVLTACASKQLELMVIILLSNINPHPVIRQYAEMELIATHPALARIREKLRAFAQNGGAVKAIFCDRLFSVDADCIGLKAIARQAQENGTVTVNCTDALTYRSALYLPDAITAIHIVSKLGKTGNIYNASSFCFSRYELKSTVYSMLARSGVKLELSDDDTAPSCAALSEGKLRSLGYEPVCGLSDAVRWTLGAYQSAYDVLEFPRDHLGEPFARHRVAVDMIRGGNHDRMRIRMLVFARRLIIGQRVAVHAFQLKEGQQQLGDQTRLALAARLVFPAHVHQQTLVHQALPVLTPRLRVIGNAVVNKNIDGKALRHFVTVRIARGKIGAFCCDAVKEKVIAVLIGKALIAVFFVQLRGDDLFETVEILAQHTDVNIVVPWDKAAVPRRAEHRASG